jgi:predicted dehydrogenase
MAEKLRAGVAGAGVFGGYHANKYTETGDAELTAIYDQSLDKAKERAAEHGAEGFDDFHAFLEAVDVLTIATPATSHAGLAAEAIAQGKHVLVEKPIAMTTQDADALIKAAEAQGVFIQVGHQERYVAAAFGLFDRAVPAGVVSRRMNRYSPRAADVSVVLDLMIHDLDLLAQLTGASEARLLSIDSRRQKSDFADYVDAVLDVGGVEARLIASRLEEDPVRDLRLSYEDGEVHLDFLKRAVSNTTGTPVPASFDGDDLPLALKDPLAFGTQSFLEAVRSRTNPAVPGQAGRRALKMALVIEDALS